jgi:hypothetical protein
MHLSKMQSHLNAQCWSAITDMWVEFLCSTCNWSSALWRGSKSIQNKTLQCFVILFIFQNKMWPNFASYTVYRCMTQQLAKRHSPKTLGTIKCKLWNRHWDIGGQRSRQAGYRLHGRMQGGSEVSGNHFQNCQAKKIIVSVLDQLHVGNKRK